MTGESPVEAGGKYEEIEKRIEAVRKLNEWPIRFGGIVAVVAQLGVVAPVLFGVIQRLYEFFSMFK